MDKFIGFLFFLIPVAAIAFFVVSLCLYISANKKNGTTPDYADKQILKSRKAMLIISSVIAGVLVAVVIGLVILISLSIKYM